MSIDAAAAERLIDELVCKGSLNTADQPAAPEENALAAWESWNPAAGYFHSATRFASPENHASLGLRASSVLVERDFPAPLKSYPDEHRLDLPPCSREGELADALSRRRTWREFSDRKITLSDAATLLGLTFGVERWLEVGSERWVALKSAPSGGARHSIEAYLVALGIEGLDNGTYHYCPDAHALTPLESPTPPDFLARVMPTQPGFHHPAAFVVMTSVFARMQWRYGSPHAYRVVYLDAGHLSQTFLLVATSLGLAPFCTAAIEARVMERHLGIDGVSEAVIQAVGVGHKPEGKQWAPKHDGTELPRTRAPEWARRLPSPALP